MVSLVVLVGAKVAYTTEINNTCQQSMLFSFLFFFPYFNEYFHIHVWKLLQLYGYLIYGQVASNQAQPISEFGFVSRRMNRKKQGRNWIGNTVLSSNPRGPKHLHQYNPFFFFSTISIISVTDMKHSLICSYFIGFVGFFLSRLLYISNNYIYTIKNPTILKYRSYQQFLLICPPVD